MDMAEEGQGRFLASTSGLCTHVHTGAGSHTYTNELKCIHAAHQMHMHMKRSLKKKREKNCILTTDLSQPFVLRGFEIVLFKIKLEHS